MRIAPLLLLASAAPAANGPHANPYPGRGMTKAEYEGVSRLVTAGINRMVYQAHRKAVRVWYGTQPDGQVCMLRAEMRHLSLFPAGRYDPSFGEIVVEGAAWDHNGDNSNGLVVEFEAAPRRLDLATDRERRELYNYLSVTVGDSHFRTERMGTLTRDELSVFFVGTEPTDVFFVRRLGLLKPTDFYCFLDRYDQAGAKDRWDARMKELERRHPPQR